MAGKRGRKKKEPVGITPEFVSDMAAASVDEKKATIVKLQKGIDEAVTFLKTDEAICSLREELKLCEAPTKETIKALRNRTKYILDLLNQDGAI